jgi:hypothetical protein
MFSQLLFHMDLRRNRETVPVRRLAVKAGRSPRDGRERRAKTRDPPAEAAGRRA